MRIWTSPTLKAILRGDEDLARELKRKASAYVGNLFDTLGGRTYGVGSWTISARGVTGTLKAYVWDDVLGKRAVVKLFAEGGELLLQAMVLVVWQPEGIVLTPKSAAAPGGWGAPRLDGDGEPINPPFGTAYSAVDQGGIKQVLLNCYEHNKYPDKAFKNIEWGLLPLFYEEALDTPKHRDGKQYPDGRFVEATFESEVIDDAGDPVWFCHWPEEGTYSGELKVLFDLTNERRAGLGVERLTGPIRGYYAYMASVVLQEASRAGVLAHESEAFREGYQSASSRMLKDGMVDEWGENLAANNGDGGSTFAQWVGSAEHRDLLDKEWGDSKSGQSTELQLAQGVLSGQTTWAMNFATRKRWVWAEKVTWEGTLGRVSWDGPPDRHGFHVPNSWTYYGKEPVFGGSESPLWRDVHAPRFCLGGRLVTFNEPGDTEFRNVIVGVGIAADGVRVVTIRSMGIAGSYVNFRLAVWFREVDALCEVDSVVGGDGYTTAWALEFSDARWIQYPVGGIGPLYPRHNQALFSQDGTKFVIAKTETVGDVSRARWFEYSGGTMTSIGDTSSGFNVLGIDYIDNERRLALVGGNGLSLPDRTHIIWANENSFAVLLYVNIQMSTVVDYWVTIADRNGAFSSGSVSLRVNGEEIWNSGTISMVVQDPNEPPYDHEYYFPLNIYETVNGRYGGDSPGSNAYTSMPPIGKWGNDFVVGEEYRFRFRAHAVVAHYKDEMVAWVKQRNLPFTNDVLVAEGQQDQVYSTLSLEELTGVEGLHKDIFPLGVV